MCSGPSTGRNPQPLPPPPPPAPAPPPPVLELTEEQKKKKSKTEAQSSQGIKSLRIDRTSGNIGAAGGGLNIPS